MNRCPVGQSRFARYTVRVRVIAGQYRGRVLETPEGLATRPILDRVKASVFDWLGSRLAQPGHLPPLNVLDLFCGAGSIGIEALSRGAACCVFVEKDRSALDFLRRNLEKLRANPTAMVVPRPAESLAISPPDGGAFGLIFLDPPYPLSEDVGDETVMGRVMTRLGDRVPTTTDALLLWRHDDNCHLPSTFAGGWRETERRTWGGMAVTMYERTTNK